MNKSRKGKIKVVFFDIGNVLLDFDPHVVIRGLAWAVRRHPFKIVQLWLKHSLVDDVERGKITVEQLFRMFREELEYTGSYARFRKLWCGGLSYKPRSIALLKKVAARTRTYLLSNTNEGHYRHIRERFVFPDYVKGAVLSYRVRMRKPEPDIYRVALKRVRVRPDQVLFIDDLAVNVKAARDQGWNAVRFIDEAQMERDLKKYGVL